MRGRYIPDEKLVGRLIRELDGEIQNIDFWIDFTTDDFFVEEVPDYISFQNCLGSVCFYIQFNFTKVLCKIDISIEMHKKGNTNLIESLKCRILGEPEEVNNKMEQSLCCRRYLLYLVTCFRVFVK